MARQRRKGRDVQGIVLLDKPVGRGSNEVLQAVKRLYRARKAGHTGSLDRLAGGLLPICLGEATKMSGFLLNADKRYLARVRLGEATTTGDAEGEVVETADVSSVTEDAVRSVLERFTGPIQQIPPMHSAIKHQGERLYKLAHQGLTVERKPREVTVHSLELLGIDGVHLEIDVLCSKGTYIRTLAEDIGRALGVCAHVAMLRRTRSGPFDVADARTLDALEALADEGMETLDGILLPMEAALEDWPNVSLPDDVAYYLRMGQPVMVPHAPTRGLVRIYGRGRDFLGVGEVLSDGRIAPRRLVNTRA